MAEGKWIAELRADLPVDEAGRLALRVRFEAVQKCVQPALRWPPRNPEHVHDLRVSTRRATAALDVFAFLLPKKTYRRARRKLRRLRRAAGAARDWDVFLAALDHSRRSGRSGDFIRGYAVGQRLAAQVKLADKGEAYAHAGEQLAADVASAVRASDSNDDRHQLADLARPMLAGLLQQLRDVATRDLTVYQHLHRVRVIGKRLRYAMELFVDCFAAPFRATLYPAIEQMQDILGHANDSQVAQQHLTRLKTYARSVQSARAQRFATSIEALIRGQQRRLVQQRRLFERWWKEWEKRQVLDQLGELARQEK